MNEQKKQKKNCRMKKNMKREVIEAVAVVVVRVKYRKK